MMRWLVVILLLPFAGCSHYHTQQDCFDICKSHGLRFVKVEHEAASGYDNVERREVNRDACRCE
jgi:hypothetical protein